MLKARRQQLKARLNKSRESRGGAGNKTVKGIDDACAATSDEAGEGLREEEQGCLNTRQADALEAAQHRSQENQRIYRALEQLNSAYAHQASREILNYCKQEGIRLIVTPSYGQGIDFSDKRYFKTDAYEWQGRKIISYLKYKAFQDGIVVTGIPPGHITDRCAECGSSIRRFNEGHRPGLRYHGGKLFLCPNGHRGSTAENTAKNIGRYFLGYFKEGSKVDGFQK